MVLDNLLKIGFNRPRPQIFKWGTYAVSSSFPSGHAMSSVIVYGTVAYLAARLQRNVASRMLTMAFAALIIVAHLRQPAVSRRALSVGRARRPGHRVGVGGVLHGGARGRAALRETQRAADAQPDEGRPPRAHRRRREP